MNPGTYRIMIAGVLLLSLTSYAVNSTVLPPNLDVIVFSDGTHCGMQGTAQSAAGKSLSKLKNRYNPVKPTNIHNEVTLTSILQPGDDIDRFKSSWGARITGYVIDVKPGGHTEVCNCGERLPVDRDTHIELALTTNAPEIQRVVVEVTPRLRQIMKQQGIDWSTETLRGNNNPSSQPKSIYHKWVEITGWMMFDTMHVDQAENTNPGGDGNWRATGWEIHPITAMRVLPSPPLPTQPSTAQSLTTAQSEYSTGLTPQKRQQIRNRNAQKLASFPPSERERDNQ